MEFKHHFLFPYNTLQFCMSEQYIYRVFEHHIHRIGNKAGKRASGVKI